MNNQISFITSVGNIDSIDNKTKDTIKIKDTIMNGSTDPRPPETVTWNPWHGCHKVSAGCDNCYMFTRDQSYGKDPRNVHKTKSFNLPVRKLRSGPHKGLYKIPAGSHIYTCFTSDFFHPAADEWRQEAWEMMRERSDCTFFMITKRPERITQSLPSEWDGQQKLWHNITMAVTCEDQRATNRRLPVYLSLPLRHFTVIIEPMLGSVNLRPFFDHFKNTDSAGQVRPLISSVSVGGESGPNARVCDFGWVLDLQLQCVEAGVAFSYHQTGARLRKGGKVYSIPRKLQVAQAKKAGLDFDGEKMVSWGMLDRIRFD